MNLLKIDSIYERECLESQIRGFNNINGETLTELKYLVNWSLNFNYWTGGKNTSSGPVWCPGQQSVSNASQNIFSNSSTGNEEKECLQLKIIQKAAKNFKWRLQFRSCKGRSIFACEVKTL
jgi:hypothetical protein